jgi:hypothetical protein
MNAIPAPHFQGNPADDYLPKLAKYLASLSPVADVRVPLQQSFGIESAGHLLQSSNFPKYL